MKEIVLYVEGDSDKAIAKALLRCVLRELERAGVSLECRPAGGRNKLLWKIPKYVRLSLAEPGTLGVFALTDSDAPAHTAEEKLDELRQAATAGTTAEMRRRVHTHVAVPQIEAWLLADEAAVAEYLAALGVEVPESWPAPEELSNAEEDLKKLFRRIPGRLRGYMPTVDGPQIASRAHRDIVAKKCPRFRAFIEDLEETARLSAQP